MLLSNLISDKTEGSIAVGSNPPGRNQTLTSSQDLGPYGAIDTLSLHSPNSRDLLVCDILCYRISRQFVAESYR